MTALIAGVAAVIGGGVTAIFGPWIKHALEQRSERRAQQREQIQKWRAMLLQVERECEYANEVGQRLQLHPDYLSLEPLLTSEVKTYVYGDNRSFVVGQSLPEPLEKVKEDIARVEREWGLP